MNGQTLRMTVVGGALCFSATLCAASNAVPSFGPAEPPFQPTHPIAIVGGTVIDATGAAPKLNYTVVIDGERITKVGRTEDVDIPEGAHIIDAEGMTVMPGIINSNQHLQLNPLYPAPTA